MTIIVRNGTFHDDDLAEGTPGVTWVDFAELDSDDAPRAQTLAVRLPNSADPFVAMEKIGGVAAVAIPFPAFSDGRGFGLARWLRRLGFKGRLRAHGHLIADQYPFALRCGFDEIAIDEALAARQDESQWRAQFEAAAGPGRTYQERLRKSA